jgi:hypothetical protein
MRPGSTTLRHHIEGRSLDRVEGGSATRAERGDGQARA